MKKKLLLIIFIGLLYGCSTKNDSFNNRAFHRSTAWFNTLFNAEEEMDKSIGSIEKQYKDNYSEILPVDPRPVIVEEQIAALADNTSIDDQASKLTNRKPSGSAGKNQNEEPKATGFDLVEKKALKAIENHSMYIKGSEKNKAMTRAYLILGKARYNKGKGFEALDALSYLQTKLPYHKKFTPESYVYSALANIQTGNVFEGERILETLYKDNGYKKPIRTQIAKNYAQFLINEDEYENAIPVLDEAISKSKNKERKARYHFIEGQLYSALGMQQEAGEEFTKVYKMKPGFEMEVKSQLAIAANFDPKNNSYNNYKEHLLSISKKGNYVSRKNEFFYAIGDMAIKADKAEEAIKYLKMSFEGEASDPYIRSRAYERYADLEFENGSYVHATAYYDSALAVAPYQKDIKRIEKRNKDLKILMEKYYLVKKNDSILKLAYMPKEEKEKFFSDFIAKLKIEDEKKARQAEQEMTNFQTQIKSGDFTSTFGEETGGNSSFYFYNTSQKANGQLEFKRIWGNSRLADNWRSSTNTVLSLDEQEAQMLGQTESSNPRRYELEYYLETIPNKPKDLHKLKIERDTTELSLGIGYFDLFKNAKTATETLEHLVSTPPKEQTTEAQALYQLYRINNKVENLSKSDEFKNLILTKYPNSKYAEYILNPEVDYTTPTTKEALAFYEETYNAYKEEKYDEVKKRVTEAIQKYPTEAIMAKYTLLNALVIGKTEGRESFISALELVTVAYQNTEEGKKAKEILDYLNQKQKNLTKMEEVNAEKETNQNVESTVEKKMENQSEGQKSPIVKGLEGDDPTSTNSNTQSNPSTQNSPQSPTSNPDRPTMPGKK